MKKIEFTYCGHFEYKGHTVNEVYAPMPRRQHGAVVINEDDTFTAFIDPNDSYEAQQEGLLHELDEHIAGKHFDGIQDKSVSKLELEAHHIIDPQAEIVEEPDDNTAELEKTIRAAYIRMLLDHMFLEREKALAMAELAEMKKEEKKRRRRKSQKQIDKELERMGCDMDEIRERRRERAWLEPPY